MAAIRWMLVSMLVTSALTATAEQFAKPAPVRARWSVDARGEAMGLATTVDPQGATAFWWNAAPLPDGDRLEVAATAYDLYLDSAFGAEATWRPVALRASRGAFTAGLVWARWEYDVPVRTAYDPEVARFRSTNDLVQIGAAYDVAEHFGAGPTPWTWMVGSSVRMVHMSSEVEERGSTTSETGWDVDLATSLAHTFVSSRAADLRWHLTAMARNVTRGALGGDEPYAVLARSYHFGAGLDLGAGEPWRGERMVGLTVSHVWRRDLDDVIGIPETEHLGVEMRLAGIVAFRVGHRSSGSIGGGRWSWGAGLEHRFENLRGLDIGVDYARDSIDAWRWPYDTGLDHWTLRAAVDLPD